MTNEEIREKFKGDITKTDSYQVELPLKTLDTIQTMTRNDTLDELLKYEPVCSPDKDAWYSVGFKDCLEQFRTKIEGMKL